MLAFLSQLSTVSAGAPDQSIGEMRAAAAALRRPWNEGGPVMRETAALVLAGVPARLNRPEGASETAPTLAWIHGGGWTMLGLDTHDRMMREHAAVSGWAVVALDQPLAPETAYPDTIHACARAVRALREEACALGLDPGRIALGGDSSGANLAAAAALSLRDEGDPPLAGLLLAYGVYDHDLTRSSYAAFGGPPYQLTPQKMAWFWDRYCPDLARRAEPLASPLRADLAGLPPCRLVVAERDVLRDENLAFAAALEAHGVPVELDRYEAMPHGFLEGTAFLPDAGRAVARSGAWLKERAG